MKKFLFLLVACMVTGPGYAQLPKEAETVRVNGTDLYYEVYGDGEPLLLLYGWTQSSGFWAGYIPSYAPHFEVYAIDLRGHGRSSPLTSDFSIAQTAHDLNALMEYLEISQVKAIGLSFGGLVLLELTRTHAGRIASMILIGATYNYKGGENDNASFTYDDLPLAYRDELKKAHHHGENQVRALFNPDLEYQIHLSDAELEAITAKTLIFHGDRDEILGLEPAISLYDKLPDASLWILPNTGHVAISGDNQNSFLGTSLRFLSAGDDQKAEHVTD